MELVYFVRHPGHKRPGSIRLLDNSTRLQQSYILRHSLVSPSCKSGCLSHTSPELASCVRHFALQRQAGRVLAIALLSLARQSHCFVSFRSSRVRSTATRARQAVLRCPVVSFPPRGVLTHGSESRRFSHAFTWARQCYFCLALCVSMAQNHYQQSIPRCKVLFACGLISASLW